MISVVIPTYNYAQYLPDSLESAISQTYAPYEIIVIDDGSTDETPEVIEPYLSNAKVRYLRTENCGVSAARNKGIELSKSDLIAFLDADDTWVPEKLELQLPLFNNNSVGVVYSLRRPFNEQGPIKGYKHVDVFRGHVLQRLMMHNFISMSSAIVRRECLERAGLFDVQLSQGEDMDLWLRIAGEGYEFDYVNRPLVNYRLGGQASNPALWDKRYQDNRMMLKKFFSDPKYKTKVSMNMRRHAWAALWRKRGYGLREQRRNLEALKCGVASLIYVPNNKMAWGVVVKSIVQIFMTKRVTSDDHNAR
jgi:glycosyltransferase involved in cell wall biosynthesis